MVMPPTGGLPPPTDPMGGPQMGAPMPPMAPQPALDPALFLELGKAVRAEMERQVEEMMQPSYPVWYDEKDYPNPDAALVQTKARQLEAEFSPLRTRILDDLRLVRMETSGVWKDFDADEDDPWIDTGISGEVELVAAQLADSQVSFDATAKTRDLEDEAAKKVDFAISSLDHANRLHAIAGNGSLPIEKARTLVTTGRLAWHCLLNLDADEDEMPFHEYLVDPASCYPVFESGRGLRVMVRIYQTTVGEAIASFDDAENSMYQKLVANPMKRGEKGRDESESCEVIEYWDRRWRVVLIDGEEVRKPMEHGYGFVPFVYKLGPLGMPAFMRDPQKTDLYGDRGVHWLHNRDVAMPHKGIGLPRLLKLPTQQREAMYTRMLSAFAKSIDPPLAEYIDETEYNKGVSEVSRARGDVTPIKMARRQLEEIATNPNANVLMPLLQGTADNNARFSQPPTAHGLNDHSNVSGYATQGLNEAGRIKLVPWLRTLEEFERECMEMRFRMFRDWGYMVRQGVEGNYGSIMVPVADAMPNQDQMFELRPDDLKRAGVRIKVSMTNMPIQMLGPTANAVSMLMNMGLIDRIGALKLLNTQNPYKVLQRIDESEMMSDPVIREMEVIERLEEQGLHEYAMYFTMRKMADQMGQGGQPGGPPGGGGPPAPPGAMGDSQAAMGQGPGPGSGPQGPVAPPDPFGTEQ